MKFNPFRKSTAVAKPFSVIVKRRLTTEGRWLPQLDAGTVMFTHHQVSGAALCVKPWGDVQASGVKLEFGEGEGNPHRVVIADATLTFQTREEATQAFETAQRALHGGAARIPTWLWVVGIVVLLLVFAGGPSKPRDQTAELSGLPAGYPSLAQLPMPTTPNLAPDKPSVLALLDDKAPSGGGASVNPLLDPKSPLLAKCPSPGGK